MRTMAVVGTGLIGTSVALAAARHGVTVYLVDRDDAATRTAAALGAGVPGPPPAPVDLAVLAVPPSAVGTVLGEQQARGLAHSYTDVASVKEAVEQQVLRGAVDPGCFVGGHPLAGGERSGPLAARAALFEGRSWVLTPSPATSQTTLNRALEMITLCGGVPLLMDSRYHDEVTALISHVPHVVASLMAARLRHAPREAARLAGQGVRDVTRVAAGDVRLWSDILRANAAPVVRVLRGLREDLDALLGALEGLATDAPDACARELTDVAALLEQGVTGVAEVLGGHGAEPVGGTRLRVTLGPGQGQLARLLSALTEFDVGVEDVVTRPAADADGLGLEVEFSAPAVTGHQLLRHLTADGWHAESALPAAGDVAAMT